ncbi:unnamed protein product, partial [Mesorhabditis spiculigera]
MVGAKPAKDVLEPIYTGMRKDIVELYKRFQEGNTARIAHFRTVFRSMHFEKIFAGRLDPGEHVEFTERLLQMAASYMHPFPTAAPSVFTERVPVDCHHTTQLAAVAGNPDEPQPRELLERIFGVYLTYSLYFLQPSDYVVPIRVTPVQMIEMTRLQRELIHENHLDTVATLLKLHAYKAFVLAPFASSYDYVTHRRFELSEDELLQLQVLSGVNPAVNFTSQLERIKAAMQSSVEALSSPPKESNSSENTRSDIRNRAYSGKVQHSRNRRYADPEMVPGAYTEIKETKVTALNSNEAPSTSAATQEPEDPQLDQTADQSDQDEADLLRMINDEESASESSPTKRKRASNRPTPVKIKRPTVEDKKLKERLRVSITPTALTKANNRLMERLRRSTRGEDSME